MACVQEIDDLQAQLEASRAELAALTAELEKQEAKIKATQKLVASKEVLRAEYLDFKQQLQAAQLQLARLQNTAGSHTRSQTAELKQKQGDVDYWSQGRGFFEAKAEALTAAIAADHAYLQELLRSYNLVFEKHAAEKAKLDKLEDRLTKLGRQFGGNGFFSSFASAFQFSPAPF